jgi:acyl carrier protein
MDRPALLDAFADILEKCIDRRPDNLTEATTLREGLSLDSIDLFSLIVEAQTRFGIDIPTEEMASVTTVGQVLDVIQAKLAKKTPAA